MPEQYRSDKFTIGQLLTMSDKPIVVSSVQRDYSWDATQVKAFWDDLISFSDAHPGNAVNEWEYFLGAIVLAKAESSGYVLIDGYQRLATATILLSVIRDVLKAYDANASRQTQSDYIVKTDYTRGVSPNYERTYKFIAYPHDRDFFRQLVQDEAAGTQASATQESHKLIAKARRFLDEQLRKRGRELGGGDKAFNDALRIQSVLANHVSLVAAIATDEQKAYEVFETLNDRGIGVSADDLIRNFIMLKASGSQRTEVEANMERVWALIEPDLRMEDFFRHHWLSHRGDLKSRSLYRELRGSFEAEETDPVEYSRQLVRSATIYARIGECEDTDAEVCRYLEAVKALRAQALMPALLSVFELAEEGTIAAKDLLWFVRAVVALYVRHNEIGGLESTVLEEKLYRAARELRQSGLANTMGDLLKGAPSDDDFRDSFAKWEMGRSQVARYLLRELEVFVRRTGEVDVVPTKVNLEHIYPVSPEAGGRDPELDAVRGRIGNLTILSIPLNAAAKNGAFSTKQPVYAKSDILLTKELGDTTKYAKWTLTEFEQRTKELSTLAVKAWPIPKP